MAQTNLEVIISARDQFTGTANKVIGSLNRMQSSAGKVGKGIGQVAGGLTRLGIVAGAAAGGGLLAAAKASAEFDAQLRTINTIAHLSAGELANLGDGIKKLASEGRGDLADLSAGFYDVLSAGITDTAEAQGVLTAATTLAIGGLSTNAQAVDLLTTAINAYGQSAGDAQKDADLFAKAIEIGKVTADEIAASFANIAPIAAQTGIEIEEVAAAFGALTAQGVPASEVATQMQRAIVDLLNPSKQLLELQQRTGKDFFGIAQSQGLVAALQQMRDAVGGDEQAFKDLFGRIEGYKFALQTTGPQQEKYNAALDAMADSAGTAAEQMGERTGGLAFQANRLRTNITLAAIAVGEGFAPALGRLADKLSAFISANGPELRQFGREIGRAIDNIDFDDLLKTARSMAATFRNDVLPVLKLAFDAFNALPGPIKGIAASLALLSQTPVIGGALGQILSGVGNIGSGILEGAGRATVGKLLPQPVFVTNWPPSLGAGGASGVAGKGGGVLGVLGAVTIAGITLGAASVLGDALIQATGGKTDGRGREVGNIGPIKVVVGQSQSDRRGIQPIPLKGGAVPVVPATSGGFDPDTRDEIRRAAQDGKNTARANAEKFRGSIDSGANRTVAAIRGIRPPTVITNVDVKVTAGQVQQSVYQQTLYGPPNGSAGGGGGSGGNLLL